MIKKGSIKKSIKNSSSLAKNNISIQESPKFGNVISSRYL